MRLPRAGARFCTSRCRVYSYRASKRSSIPAELSSRDRWVRRSALKRPLTAGGKAASSTDSRTWSTFSDARESTVGAGLGFVLNGDGIGCVDLDGVLDDGVLDPRAVELLTSLEAFYVEVSPSGKGIHAWVYGGSPSGRKVYTQDDGLNVEWYESGRYITITGEKFKW